MDLSLLAPPLLMTVAALAQAARGLKMEPAVLHAAFSMKGGPLSLLKAAANSDTAKARARLAKLALVDGVVVGARDTEKEGRRLLPKELGVYAIASASLTACARRITSRGALDQTHVMSLFSDAKLAAGSHTGRSHGSLARSDVVRVLDSCKQPGSNFVIFGLLRLAPRAHAELTAAGLAHLVGAYLPPSWLSLYADAEARGACARGSADGRAIIVPPTMSTAFERPRARDGRQRCREERSSAHRRQVRSVRVLAARQRICGVARRGGRSGSVCGVACACGVARRGGRGVRVGPGL
jgi:hypothetical protein